MGVGDLKKRYIFYKTMNDTIGRFPYLLSAAYKPGTFHSWLGMTEIILIVLVKYPRNLEIHLIRRIYLSILFVHQLETVLIKWFVDIISRNRWMYNSDNFRSHVQCHSMVCYMQQYLHLSVDYKCTFIIVSYSFVNSVVVHRITYQWPLLLTWFNFNHSMDK